MAELGEPTYFGLGDKDIALHLFRTAQLRAGRSLSQVTESLRQRMAIASRILPMSDHRVATRVRTPAGWLAFQEFFVRERCEPEVLDLDYQGSEQAQPAPGVLEAIRAADAILICPSNPISSVGPILAVPGIRSALAETPARVSAVSPIVGDAPVSGPAGKMMRAKGLEVSALGVADAYAGLLIKWSSTSAMRTTLPPCRLAVFEQSSPKASWARAKEKWRSQVACSRHSRDNRGRPGQRARRRQGQALRKARPPRAPRAGSGDAGRCSLRAFRDAWPLRRDRGLARAWKSLPSHLGSEPRYSKSQSILATATPTRWSTQSRSSTAAVSPRC